MDRTKIYVFLDPAHCNHTSGKSSPDKKLLEYKYSREIISRIEARLDDLDIMRWNSHPEVDFVYKTKGNCKDLDSRDLVMRADRINKKYDEVKALGYKAFMISVHVNAAGNGGWYNAQGWSCWTTKGQNNSDKLADKMYDAAEEVLKPLKKKIRTDMSDKDRDYESDFYILKKSNCPCVLTENFFMDNKEDVEWLLTEEGKNAIVELHVKGILKWIDSL